MLDAARKSSDLRMADLSTFSEIICMGKEGYQLPTSIFIVNLNFNSYSTKVVFPRLEWAMWGHIRAEGPTVDSR